MFSHLLHFHIGSIKHSTKTMKNVKGRSLLQKLDHKLKLDECD